MRKKYSVDENQKIENGKSREFPSKEEYNRISDNMPEANQKIEDGKLRIIGTIPGLDDDIMDFPIEVQSIAEKVVKEYTPEIPKYTYRQATPKDIVFDREVQVRSNDGIFKDEVRIVEILNVNSFDAAFNADNGKTYGLDNTFIMVKK